MPWWRFEIDGGGDRVLVTWWHLAFACRVPWWPTQDGDQAKRLGITLVRVGQVAGRREGLWCPNRTTLNRVSWCLHGSLHILSLTALLTALRFPHLLFLAYLYFPS